MSYYEGICKNKCAMTRLLVEDPIKQGLEVRGDVLITKCGNCGEEVRLYPVKK